VGLRRESGNSANLTIDAGEQGNSINGSYSIVYADEDTNSTLSGSDDLAYLYGASGNGVSFTLDGGSGNVLDGTYASIIAAENAAFDVGGSDDTFGFANSGQTITATASGLTTNDGIDISLTGGTFGNLDDLVNSIDNTLDFTGDQQVYNLGGDGNTSDMYDLTQEDLSSGSDNTIYATGEDIDLTNDLPVTIDGDWDLVTGDDQNMIIDGTDDETVGNDDYAWGSSDTDFTYGDDNTDAGLETDSDELGSGFGWPGLTVGGGAMPIVNVVAQYDSANGYQVAGAAAIAGFADAAQSAAGELATTAAGLADDPTTLRWAGHEVTWSFAAAATSGPSPISSAIGQRYEPVIESAIDAWASASGITFTQVAPGADPDILIGWGDFDTAASGVIGYIRAGRRMTALCCPVSSCGWKTRRRHRSFSATAACLSTRKRMRPYIRRRCTRSGMRSAYPTIPTLHRRCITHSAPVTPRLTPPTPVRSRCSTTSPLPRRAC